jgi:hypothetical protein
VRLGTGGPGGRNTILVPCFSHTRSSSPFLVSGALLSPSAYLLSILSSSASLLVLAPTRAGAKCSGPFPSGCQMLGRPSWPVMQGARRRALTLLYLCVIPLQPPHQGVSTQAPQCLLHAPLFWLPLLESRALSPHNSQAVLLQPPLTAAIPLLVLRQRDLAPSCVSTRIPQKHWT